MAKLKICGLFREEDIDAANEAAPDFIGFVFAPSRRQVDPARAARLRSRLREGIRVVGVFTDAPAGEIAALCRDGLIDMVQDHGGGDAARLAELRESCGVPVIKALSLGPGADASAFAAADFLLFDGASPGGGRPFDWSLLRGEGCPVPCFIAGGIDLDNIEEALRLGPFGIDVSSGAESGGFKDRAKMMALADKVRRFNITGGER
ncbi:MAG: phosphoribosylanthranilate isomerase [Spirochaetaceae bacterium]|jgi:phosphoribosylanthranilate isomerase|nr:phosphoribosylanthranilate isomerase [Spirochaetaceae bacterium]